ncbi:MAG: ABC transporter permease [Clostridiaceae bacterium]
MQVFKLCLKILKKNVPSMLIYIVIFLTISLIMSSYTSSDKKKEDLFTQVKSNIAFINEESSPLIDGLRHELEKVAVFVEIPDDTYALQDALYFRSVSYILRIPEGFAVKFMNGENVQLEKTVVPNSYNNTYIDLTIDEYFNTARLYLQQQNDISQQSLVQRLQQDLSEGAAVKLKTLKKDSTSNIYANYYYNYLPYSLLYILIQGMSALMLVFNNRDLKKRNACSPLSSNNINMQFMLANVLFTFVAWLIMVVFCFLFNYKNSFSVSTVYFILNSLVFAVCGASISFLIGNLVKSIGAIAAVSNVVTLGLSFISGVFVPQEMLGSFVLRIASFTPTYWYVKANNQIAGLTQFDFSHLELVFSAMLIQIGFALAFFAVTLAIAKKKRFSC